MNRRDFLLKTVAAAVGAAFAPAALAASTPDPVWYGVDLGADDDFYVALMHQDAADAFYEGPLFTGEIGRYESIRFVSNAPEDFQLVAPPGPPTLRLVDMRELVRTMRERAIPPISRKELSWQS